MDDRTAPKRGTGVMAVALMLAWTATSAGAARAQDDAGSPASKPGAVSGVFASAMPAGAAHDAELAELELRLDAAMRANSVVLEKALQREIGGVLEQARLALVDVRRARAAKALERAARAKGIARAALELAATRKGRAEEERAKVAATQRAQTEEEARRAAEHALAHAKQQRDALQAGTK